MAEQWERDVLKTLGAPVTSGTLRLLRSWQAREGGHTNNNATWNWLNTTKGKQFPAINSVGVRAFPDYRTGVAYTADTIIGGYPSVVEALRSGKPYLPKYRSALIGDFSKWVSGDRTARPDYGQKVLGFSGPIPSAPRASSPQVGPTKVVSRGPKNRMDLRLLAGVLDDGDDFWDLVAANPIDFPKLAQPVSTPHPMTQAAPTKGNAFSVPLEWQGTHVTDGLGWGTKTANDFMLPAGTPLNVPESGTVEYFHPTGAQGGGSVRFRGDSGKIYWFGHIDKGVPAGTRLRKGQRFANVADQNVSAPHLHADVQ